MFILRPVTFECLAEIALQTSARARPPRGTCCSHATSCHRNDFAVSLLGILVDQSHMRTVTKIAGLDLIGLSFFGKPCRKYFDFQSLVYSRSSHQQNPTEITSAYKCL